jgi:thiol-disulfide isomerase/thioredoxin
VRLVYKLTLLGIGLGLCGCSSTKNSMARNTGNTSPTANINNTSDNRQPFWAQPDTRSPILNTPTGSRGGANGDGVKLTAADQPDVNGVLAGRLVDVFGRRPVRATIQVQPTDGGNGGKPIEISVGDDGYFMIPGLTPSRAYMLTARAQDGTHYLAGRVQAIPPNPRLVIKLNEDPSGADATTVPTSVSNPSPPPLPPMPTLDRTRGGSDWMPGGTGGTSTPFPKAENDPAPPLPPPPMGAGLSPENIAEHDRPAEVRPAPRVLVPAPAAPEPDPVPGGPGGSSMRHSSPSQIPSCEIAGNRLVNFALYEPDGQPWEFRQHYGRLVLLDFWGTWCPHCIRAMPQLRELQRRYGASGLEVIGIACEDGNGPEVARRVQEVAQSRNLNYRVLLTENSNRSPLVAKFQVRSYPTMILLDENGHIIARGEGGQLQQIEAIIQQRLARK